jgi:hypothetical protein
MAQRAFFAIYGKIVPPKMGLNGLVLGQFLAFLGKLRQKRSVPEAKRRARRLGAYPAFFAGEPMLGSAYCGAPNYLYSGID